MKKLDLLFDLGKAIRSHPKAVKVWKRHGSYWVLKLQSGIYLLHDDYNRAVESDLYKIGRTYNIEKRLKDLRAGNPNIKKVGKTWIIAIVKIAAWNMRGSAM